MARLTINEIWVLEKLGGRCIFNKSYSSLTTDADLLSSFLSALYSISEELSEDSGGSKGGIESIEMGGLKWVYTEVPNLLIICASTKNDETEIIRAKVNTIRAKFIEMFPETASENFCDTFDGNVSRFDEFEGPLIELTEDWKKVDKVTSAAVLMDIIEVYQQIFHLLAKTTTSISKGKEEFLDQRMVKLKEMLPPSLENIDYTEFGWDLLSINVFNQDIKESEIRQGLFSILRFYCDLLIDVFKGDLFLKIISRLIFPYLKKDWDRIQKIKLDKEFIHLFLYEEK